VLFVHLCGTEEAPFYFIFNELSQTYPKSRTGPVEQIQDANPNCWNTIEKVGVNGRGNN
jgi:Zinc finger found in FPG and IleRS